jgi:rhamnosyltransferase
LRVEVLLATHNGERYIGQFLDSLKKQDGVEIDLVVSDDSSADKTLEIVESYTRYFRSAKVLRGPNLGAKNNFANLIKFSNSNFSAFADQDDIWLPNHLKDSIDALEKHAGMPALVFSKVIEFSEFGKNRVWPQISSAPELSILLTENLARGCTLVLNRELVNLLKKSNFENVYMHDWWAVLVAKTCGIIEFINQPTIMYRIHDSNVIGLRKPHPARLRLFWTRYFLNQEWVPGDQAKLLSAQFANNMTVQNRILVQTFANLYLITLKERYKFLFRAHLSFRQSKFENLLLKLTLLFVPIMQRN